MRAEQGVTMLQQQGRRRVQRLGMTMLQQQGRLQLRFVLSKVDTPTRCRPCARSARA